jgi:hypothetical protein
LAIIKKPRDATAPQGHPKKPNENNLLFTKVVKNLKNSKEKPPRKRW